MGSDGGTDLLEHPDTEPFKLLILVEDRLNALDFDGTVQVLLEFFLDHPRQGLIVRLKFLVMREDLGPQMIDLHRTLVRFSNDGITDVQRKRFVMEDSPGGKEDEEQNGSHHQVVLPRAPRVSPEQGILKNQEDLVEHRRKFNEDFLTGSCPPESSFKEKDWIKNPCSRHTYKNDSSTAV